jgi:HEAT repeat protein
MKIYMFEFNEYLGAMTHEDPTLRQKAVRGLAKYSGAQWQGTPDAVSAAMPALVKAARIRGEAPGDVVCRTEATKALGNIGAESPTVVAELLRLLQEDADEGVRTEAAHALGLIGERAEMAGRALAVVISDPDGGDLLRGEATWALARVSPLAPGTAATLGAAVNDRSGHVGIRAAEALWKVSGDASRAVMAIVARLGDPEVRHTAVQALYRIGQGAKAAVPALLIAMKSKDRLFRESVVMALRKIDPGAAAKAGL